MQRPQHAVTLLRALRAGLASSVGHCSRSGAANHAPFAQVRGALRVVALLYACATAVGGLRHEARIRVKHPMPIAAHAAIQRHMLPCHVSARGGPTLQWQAVLAQQASRHAPSAQLHGPSLGGWRTFASRRLQSTVAAQAGTAAAGASAAASAARVRVQGARMGPGGRAAAGVADSDSQATHAAMAWVPRSPPPSWAPLVLWLPFPPLVFGALLMQAPAALALVAGVPDALRRQMVWWLGGCSAWVFSMVVVGGITRLTRSGLSMTDWKFTGERGMAQGLGCAPSPPRHVPLAVHFPPSLPRLALQTQASARP